MARPTEGWKLRAPRGPHGSIKVRFRWAGRDYEFSTGTREPEVAAQEAARIYARTVTTKHPGQHASPAGVELEGELTRWLKSLRATLDAGTVETYALYADTHWMPFFSGVHAITERTAEEYMATRLQSVSADTVRKELSALRQFVEWAVRRGKMGPVQIPSVPKRTVGKPFKKRRRSPAIPL